MKFFQRYYLPLSTLLVLFCFSAQGQDRFSFPSSDKYKIDYAAPKEYTIGGISVVGTVFNDKNSLISITGLEVGKKIRIPGDDISQAVKKLWKLGIIGDIQISITEIVEDQVYLQLDLKERPRLSRYFFEGIPQTQQTTLSDKVKLIRGRIVTDAMIQNAINVIKRHYAEKGFNNAEVNVVPQKDSLLANSVLLRIAVDRKSKVKINEIIFEGVSQLEEKKLLKKMKKTKEKRFMRIFSPSKFVAEEFENDKQNIVDYYNQNGYRNALIVTDSVWNHDESSVNVKLKIEEGKQFHYRNIEWTGNYKYTDEQLSQQLGINRGDIYNPEELSKRLNFNPASTDITALYMDDGYLRFNINPVEVMVDEDSIDIEMRMFEGEQATINKIVVNGNTKTSDHVIFRELWTLPGQKFSRSDIIRTQQQLANMGYFDPEQIGIAPSPNPDGSVDIIYDLVERPSDQIELSGGWGGQFGFVGTLGVVFNNFSARNIFNWDSWKPLPAGDGQRLAIRMQANGRRFQTYTFTFTEPWLGGNKPNSFSVNLNHSVQRLLTFAGQVTGSLKVNGATLSLGRRLTIPDDYFILSQSLSFLVYNLDNFQTRGFNNFTDGQSYNITFNNTISRSSIDSPTYPRSGAQMSLSASFTPPYSLFSGDTFSDLSEENRFRWVEYHKWMFDNSWFMPVVGKLVFNARAHMGFIGTYNKEKGVGPFERFILGGDGLAQNNFLLGTEIVGLRGYENNSILPPESNGTGGVVYNKYVLELRYPLSLNPSATIFLLSFLEGGNNWGSFEEFNPFDLKRSAGVGARIFMRAFGMLGVDWAYGFDQITGRPGASGAQFHFTIGQQIR